MQLKGDCQTTAMGIMPHKNIEEALGLSLSLDIPFWPQLPRVSFFEDMYVQVSEHFPGINVDEEEQRISFSLDKFYQEIEGLLENWDKEKYFRLSSQYSLLFHKFLKKDLSSYPYIRGQSIGPVSYGLKILDEEKKPMIYHQEVKEILFEFVAKKVQSQLVEMKEQHPFPLVWVDEPGLEMLFMAFTGYGSEKAFTDYQQFLEFLPRPRGVHLCGNPDWSFLLRLDMDILSVDVLSWGHIFSRYREEVKAFLERGGIISWGITPTMTEEFDKESFDTMVGHLNEMWGFMVKSGIDRKKILSQAWLAPSRCCLINTDGEATVEKSFRLLNEVADHFKQEL